MKLEKGNLIKKTRTNTHPHCEAANTELLYVVERVNKNSYSIKCIEGFMKNTQTKLAKDFAAESIDVYGTVTRYEIVA